MKVQPPRLFSLPQLVTTAAQPRLVLGEAVEIHSGVEVGRVSRGEGRHVALVHEEVARVVEAPPSRPPPRLPHQVVGGPRAPGGAQPLGEVGHGVAREGRAAEVFEKWTALKGISDWFRRESTLPISCTAPGHIGVSSSTSTTHPLSRARAAHCSSAAATSSDCCRTWH
eukprot:CAMPEP_0113724464 /NCGR_PEP_ID=MMETSP0038_2-20120614/39099_1 /TAXON_ID=2898 /ORGANISM="Cryptomonas paramecium" /LENGTH=168 /DNA_ID=CAMNT_0000654379 /DNA_START=116 /DNA_END=620 /DNA_ORIENTATION=- /assembly_acc=CAM_ASM_000170